VVIAIHQNRDAVKCVQVIDEHTGATVWKLLDIIGEEPDLGVENLQGSGAIAGETSAVSYTIRVYVILILQYYNQF
jgi:acetyl-CoA carboxylase carboxyltransferase component